jgi:outer membrane protein OmpA-like peptidoglycan-associated protein
MKGMITDTRIAKLAFLLPMLLLGCTQSAPQSGGPASSPVAAPALPPILPFEQAVDNAANTVLAANAGAQRVIVIDPLVDGVTGDQSVATRRIGERITALARERYPNYRVEPFTAATVAQQPLVMVGTLTPVNGANQTTGERVAYRFCLVLADLGSGRTVAKSVARAQLDGVDATPVTFFRQSPVWSEDPAIRGYVNTCQGTRVGDAIPPDYLRGIESAALVQEAMTQFEAGRLPQALAKFEAARTTAAGDQLRVHNGLYLVNYVMGRRAQATAEFGELVDYGLDHSRLGVKFLFQPGSTAFSGGADAAREYPMWLRQIAERAGQRTTCLEIRGHTSPSGSAELNERLSTARAEAVRARLAAAAPAMTDRMIAVGVGGRENLVGTGRDDGTDALDRRVEFRVVQQCS